LRIADSDGRILRAVELPKESSSRGLEWTREGRIVVVDARDYPDEPAGERDPRGLRPSSVRVFTDRLENELDYELPFTIYDVQLHPILAGCLVAVAGGRHGRNVISIDLATKRIRRITSFGDVPYGPGRWKLVGTDRVYFVEQDAGKFALDGLYVCDPSTEEAETAVKGAQLGGPVSRFDVSGGRAAIQTARGIFLVELANGKVSVLPNTRNCHSPVFSPGGRRLVMVRDCGELVVRDLHDGKDTLLYRAR